MGSGGMGMKRDGPALLRGEALRRVQLEEGRLPQMFADSCR